MCLLLQGKVSATYLHQLVIILQILAIIHTSTPPYFLYLDTIFASTRFLCFYLLPFSILSRLAAKMQDLMPLAGAQGRPKTTYYHNGIGGRGNYHKRTEYADPASRQESARFPRALADFFSKSDSLSKSDSKNIQKRHNLTVNGESSIGKARESISHWRRLIGIGALGSRRSQRQHSQNSDPSATTVTASEYNNQALPLGAAYVIRRKIFGERSTPKNRQE